MCWRCERTGHRSRPAGSQMRRFCCLFLLFERRRLPPCYHVRFNKVNTSLITAIRKTCPQIQNRPPPEARRLPREREGESQEPWGGCHLSPTPPHDGAKQRRLSRFAAFSGSSHLPVLQVVHPDTISGAGSGVWIHSVWSRGAFFPPAESQIMIRASRTSPLPEPQPQHRWRCSSGWNRRRQREGEPTGPEVT